MADTDILYDVSQRIATVTLNRPDRLNAYTARLGDQLRAAMRRATDGEKLVTLDEKERTLNITSSGAVGARPSSTGIWSFSQSVRPSWR